MAMADYKIRIIANACITRYDRGEGTMNEILASYVIPSDDKVLIIAEIVAKRPDIDFGDEVQ